MKLPIYLDNHSTTPLDDEVFKAMLPYMKEYFGNPSSKEHSFGWIAKEAVEYSREIIAEFIGASTEEIIFTSGTTESNNLLFKGIINHFAGKKDTIITSSIEHPSILEPLKYLGTKGINIIYLPVDKYGLIDLNQLKELVTDRIIIVSVMTANNEIGTIQPIKEIGYICREKNILFHTDAAQAIGKMNLDVEELNIDFASFSAHKNYGPKGIGALYSRKNSQKMKLTPQLHGGGQEQNLRSGTLNVPAIVGFGKCIEISKNSMRIEIERIKQLRDKMLNGIFREIEDVYLNGHSEKRLVNNLNISLKNVNIELLINELRDIAFSTGSACSSGSPEGSHVLKATGLPEELMKCSVRFGLGRFNTENEIDFVIEKFVDTVKNLKKKYYIK